MSVMKFINESLRLAWGPAMNPAADGEKLFSPRAGFEDLHDMLTGKRDMPGHRQDSIQPTYRAS